MILRLGARWMEEEFSALLDDMRKLEGRMLDDPAWDMFTKDRLLRVAFSCIYGARILSHVWRIDIPVDAARALWNHLLISRLSDAHGLGGTSRENADAHRLWVRGMRSFSQQLNIGPLPIALQKRPR